MIYPPHLSNGDKVAIVAPAGRIGIDDLQTTISTLESWGLEIETGSHVFDMYDYFSSDDEGRYQDMQEALDNPQVRGIFCARGGYGTGRIIDRLDFSKFLEFPKWIIGFSDITVLHLKLHKIGVASLHGPVGRQIGKSVDNESVELLKKLLFEADHAEYNVPMNPLNVVGKANARVVGGNLTLLCNSIGTSTDIELEGKILFLEEIEEKLYSFDRLFNQLERSGKLKNLKAIIGGQFTGMKDTEPSFGKNTFEIVREYAMKYDIPVCFGLESGHEMKNLTIPYSFLCDLVIDVEGTSINFYRG